MNALQQWWNRQNPQGKRTAVIVGFTAVFLGVMWAYVAGTDDGPRSRGPSQPLIKQPLTGGNTANLGVEALASKLTDAKRDMDNLKADQKTEQEQQEKKIADLKQEAADKDQEYKRQLDASQRQIEDLKKTQDELAEQLR